MTGSPSDGFEWRTLGRLAGPTAAVGICVWGLWFYMRPDNLPVFAAMVAGVAVDFIMRLALGPKASVIWWWTMVRTSLPDDDEEPSSESPERSRPHDGLLASQDVVYEKVESRASGADGCEP